LTRLPGRPTLVPLMVARTERAPVAGRADRPCRAGPQLRSPSQGRHGVHARGSL